MEPEKLEDLIERTIAMLRRLCFMLELSAGIRPECEDLIAEWQGEE